MRVGAVIVLQRAWPAGAKTVYGLLSGSRPPDRVVVVANPSGAGLRGPNEMAGLRGPNDMAGLGGPNEMDGSPETVRALFPYFDVVEASPNRGSAAAMNLGAERLLVRGVDAVLFLEAGCILAPGAVAALEARLEEAPRVGVVGPLLARASAPLDVFSAGGFLDPRTWDPVHHREPPLVEDREGADPEPREWLDGACLLVRAEALRGVGPLDEDYVHSFADVDHHLRMRSRGWDIECVPAAVACREPGPTDPEVWVRDRLRFLTRHAPRPVLARELVRWAREAARDLGAGEGEHAAGWARGAARFLSRRWSSLHGR